MNNQIYIRIGKPKQYRPEELPNTTKRIGLGSVIKGLLLLIVLYYIVKWMLG